MATSPNTDNYTLGKGIVYFNELVDGVYQGERDLGNAPAFSFSVALEKLEHFSSRGGLKAKDKQVISQVSPALAFTLDEVNTENISLLALGTTEEVVQVAGAATAEVVTAYVDKRVALAHRNLTYWVLPYDDAAADNVLFVPGETVTGAGGATGIVLALAAGSTATTGTLYIARTNAVSFVDSEILTGGDVGLADVNSTTGGTLGTGTPVVLVQDDADTITYTAGVDYQINTALKDGEIGRILILDGAIADGDVIHVTYGYAASTYNKIKAFTKTEIEGFLRFVSDNPVGTQQELQVWRVSLTPTGDTAMIGDDWSTLGFEGEILKDETGHPLSPYMDIIMS